MAARKGLGRLRQLGPGLITGIADDDPSGIATYSQSGAQFGYALGWTMLLTLPLMAAIQLASARIGRITGQGLAENFVKLCPKWLVWGLVALLTLANVINLGADLRAMADVTALAFGSGKVPQGQHGLLASAYAGGSLLLLVCMPYRRYVGVLKWLTLSILAYVGVALAAHVDWSQALRALVWPTMNWQRDYLTTLVAILGTTISPYLFFWQASQEVEEIRRVPSREPLCTAPEQAHDGLRRVGLDTWVGMGCSNLIAYFVVVASAATLHQQGITHIESTTQAAEALRPVAGNMAFWLFACGIVGTGLLALPVLAASVAYAVASLLNARQGLDLSAGRAKLFYGVVALVMCLGLGLACIDINPMAALYWAAVVNAIAAVPIMVTVMWLSSSRKAMQGMVLPRPWQWLGWAATAAMGLASLAMFGAMLWP